MISTIRNHSEFIRECNVHSILSRLKSSIAIQANGCWEWLGHKSDKGYGVIWLPRSLRHISSSRAHRVSYQLLVGPIPEGLQLDHLCRNRACINPSHLEPVTCKENIKRGNTGKYVRNPSLRKNDVTECVHGHPYDEANTRIYRGKKDCRACDRERYKRKKENELKGCVRHG